MDRFSINSAAINSSDIRATIVYLPSAEATFSRTLSERVSILLKGTTAKTLDATGDISKVFIIGSAATDFGFEVNGTLDKFTLNFIEPVNVEWGFEPTAALTIRKRLSDASSNKALSVTGTMDPRVVLSGSTAMQRTQTARLHSVIRLKANAVALNRKIDATITLTGGLKGNAPISLVPSGNLARGVRNPFGNQTLQVTTDITGNIRGLFRFKGTSLKAIAPAGNIIRARFLQGTVEMTKTHSADLSNNAPGEDLQGFLMIRRETNREMTR